MQTTRTNWLAVFVAAGMLAFCLTAQAQTPAKQKAQLISTQRVEFGTRGTVQIIDSFGEVNVEGWDQPDVELKVTRTTQKQYEPKNLARGIKELERIKIEMERIGESSMLVIRTTFPARTPTRLMRGKTNTNLDYSIKIPRTCGLMIKHEILAPPSKGALRWPPLRGYRRVLPWAGLPAEALAPSIPAASLSRAARLHCRAAGGRHLPLRGCVPSAKSSSRISTETSRRRIGSGK